jgi:catechol 2,3-dioxygenase-like lactoylglutathione lyase family enzyme
MEMLKVSGILETALYVSDVKEAAEFYRRLFGFNMLLESERLIALDVAGRDVLLLFQEGSTREPLYVPGGMIPPHGTSGSDHFAFSISPEDVEAWQDRLLSEGVTVESRVTWPRGAKSVYFRDPDNHLVELMTPGFWRIGEP